MTIQKHFCIMKIDNTQVICVLSIFIKQKCFSAHRSNYYTASHCNHCNTLQHAATRCNTLQHAATRCNMLQHATATRCNTLQHAATRRNTLLQHTTEKQKLFCGASA